MIEKGMDVIEYIDMRTCFSRREKINRDAYPHDLMIAEAELLATTANDNDDFHRLIEDAHAINWERKYTVVMVRVGDRFVPQRRRLED